MNVSELLAKQDEGFVSLGDLLKQIASVGGGCSIKDAAAYLSRILSNEDAPSWVAYSRAHGAKTIATGRGKEHRGQELLRYTASHGWEESDDIPF